MDNSTKNILVADDTLKNIQVLGTILRDEGFQINVAQNGKQTLEMVQAVRPDLILLDIMMPEMDGFEACRHLKADPETRDIPIIFLTAKVQSEDIVQGFEVGAVDYVTKPFNKAELLQRVRTHLELKDAREKAERALVDLQSAQDQLIQSEKLAALGKLTAGIAHEINNPLGVVSSSVDVLSRCADKIGKRVSESWSQQEITEDRALKRALEALKTNGETICIARDRIVSIVEDLKIFAHLDQAELATIDLHQGIDSALNLTRYERGDDITVVKAFGDLPKVTCNPGEINQAFMTLLVRATESIDGEGSITIRTSTSSGSALIEFVDSGPALSEEDRQSLFDLNFSVQGARVGMSTGLAHVLRIVQTHKGEIRVQSGEATGNTITVVLPL